MGRTRPRRRFTLLCCLIVLVPLVVERRADHASCGAGSVLVAALFLSLAVPRTALRLARFTSIAPTPPPSSPPSPEGSTPCPSP